MKMASKVEPQDAWYTKESKVSSFNQKVAFNSQPSYGDVGENSGAAQFTRFAEGVSIAGVKYVVDGKANKLRRFVWLLLVVGSLSFMIFQIKDRGRYFMQFPTTVDVRVNYNSSILFPTVTVCNENQVRKDVAKYLNMTWIFHLFFPPYKLSFTREPDYNLLPRGNSVDWVALFTAFAQPADEAIPEGQWKGVPINSSWFTPVWTDMGLCYQFNTEKQGFHVTRAGAKFGLSLLLFANQDNYLMANSEAAGFRVLLHRANEVPRMLNLGTKISAGSITGMAVTVKSVKSLPRPYEKCNDDPTYVKSQCDLKCEADYVINKCQCRESYMPGDGVRICDLYDIFTCVEKAQTEFISSGAHEKCVCEPPCNQVLYITSISSSIQSNFLAEFISTAAFQGHVSTKFIKENFAGVDIFTSDLSYEEIQMKQAYSLLSLLCDVGGAMGLLLGSTLLTVFEIGDFICVLFSRCCSGTRVKKF